MRKCEGVYIPRIPLAEGQDNWTVDGLYHLEDDSSLIVPIENISEDTEVLLAGQKIVGDTTKKTTVRLSARAHVTERMDAKIAEMKTTETEPPPATDAQLEEDTFKELWAETQMEENELLREHLDVKRQVKSLVYQYREIFDKRKSGKTDLVKMKLKLKPGAEPVRQKYRDLNPALLADLQKQLADWQDNDVIEVSSSPWASPLVPVRKKDGEVRWAVDFRRLNASLEQDSYPLPKISSLLERAGGHKVYSTLDATSAYFNIEIKPDSQHSRRVIPI
ncbi:MAG: RNA-directed DNA polymerase [Gammaproteobacteria bacterium]|nr:RNA-directed DNA polymerase [Gammaproteobacteria bacterium]